MVELGSSSSRSSDSAKRYLCKNRYLQTENPDLLGVSYKKNTTHVKKKLHSSRSGYGELLPGRLQLVELFLERR